MRFVNLQYPEKSLLLGRLLAQFSLVQTVQEKVHLLVRHLFLALAETETDYPVQLVPVLEIGNFLIKPCTVKINAVRHGSAITIAHAADIINAR